MHTQSPIEDLQECKLLFYDIETDHQFAPYAKLRMIGMQVGLHGKRFIVKTTAEIAKFKKMLQDPTVLKFGWNNKSFDDIVLYREGYPICEENSHDLMLIMKAIAPSLPSYSLKFGNWYYFGDPHFPEMELERWAMHNRADKWSGPDELVEPYCLHDITQTANMFRLTWDVVIREKHWAAYLIDLSQGEPLRQMELEGGLWLDAANLTERVATLQWQKLGWEQLSYQLSDGKVENPNSPQQIGLYLSNKGFELELSDRGLFAVPQAVLHDIIDLENPANDKDSVARCTFEVRKINSSLKYYENYLEALKDTTYPKGFIPVQYSISNARTRRYTSNSMYKLNFQNPDKEAKKVQLVPEGWLDVWIDSTQVENVVHIYESKDYARRIAYTADPKWNEYVWLCNRILGGNRTKDELDEIVSPQVSRWSIYKQFKTIKLALNFGMGVAKFCSTSGLDIKAGKKMFDLVHEACPAIHQLQTRVANELVKNGHVTDAFGHIYSGSPRQAYKVVAYMIQGCGTGSLPKSQIRANYDTLKERGGIVCGTCHDENAMRLPLSLGPKKIIATLQELMYNMTEKFSCKFDNIPLRAKLYLSRTTAYARQEIEVTDLKQIREYCMGH